MKVNMILYIITNLFLLLSATAVSSVSQVTDTIYLKPVVLGTSP